LKETVVLDVRNTFEHAIGSFRNAIEPGMRAFTQFDRWAGEKQPINML
jgi:predicted sulfurtransferase